MKAVTPRFLLLAFALFAAPRALAQQALSVIDLARVSAKNSGEWVEYSVYDGKRSGAYRMRLSVFVDRKQRRWMEVWSDQDQTALRFPVGAAGSVYMKRGGAVYRVSHAEAPKDCGASCNTADEKGQPEVLQTGSGALPCRRLERRDATLWLCDRIPALKIAKARFIDGSHWEHLRQGVGGRSAFQDGFEKIAQELSPIMSQERKASEEGRPRLPGSAAPAQPNLDRGQRRR